MSENLLEELLVVELASVLAGPAVGMFLAEMGARVIKVENPRTGGDVTRSWRTVEEVTEIPGAYFTAVNWGKESIAIDLDTAGGRAILYDLVRLADVVVASYKAGDATRLGVDWDSLAALNPRLVYAEVSAYGDQSSRVGYDAVIQAEAGFTSMNGTAASGPLKMPVALMDLLAGHQLKEGILCALLRRERSGRGARVQVSLFDSGIAALANQAANALMTGAAPRRMGSGHPNVVPYGTAYRCRDGGYLVVAVGTDEQFRRLATCLDDPELGRDCRFETNSDRVRHRDVLEAALEVRFAKLDCDKILEGLESHGVPAGRVRDVPDVLAGPEARPLVLHHPGGAAAVRTRVFQIDGESRPCLSVPPGLSQHADDVLTGLLGYPMATVEDLKRDGVVLIGGWESADG